MIFRTIKVVFVMECGCELRVKVGCVSIEKEMVWVRIVFLVERWSPNTIYKITLEV